MYSIFGFVDCLVYSVSKGVIVQFICFLVCEYVVECIWVNVIVFGWIDMLLGVGFKVDVEVVCWIMQCMLLVCWGEVFEVVSVVVFFCGFGVSFVIGVVLVVDGGYFCV